MIRNYFQKKCFIAAFQSLRGKLHFFYPFYGTENSKLNFLDLFLISSKLFIRYRHFNSCKNFLVHTSNRQKTMLEKCRDMGLSTFTSMNLTQNKRTLARKSQVVPMFQKFSVLSGDQIQEALRFIYLRFSLKKTTLSVLV